LYPRSDSPPKDLERAAETTISGGGEGDNQSIPVLTVNAAP